MPHHQVDHGNPDPCFGGGGHDLEVFAQSLQAMEPAEHAFHNPAPLQNLKALGVPGAFHDCQEGRSCQVDHFSDRLLDIPEENI